MVESVACQFQRLQEALQNIQEVVYVDCDLGGDCVTRRSRTGFAVFLNNAPLHWMSRKQTSCEVSTFGSEFTAMNCKPNVKFTVFEG